MHQKAKGHSHHSHFAGKEALRHVIEARLKGRTASDEIHGTEMPGHISAFADAAKETSLLLIVLWTIFTPHHFAMVVFAAGWLVWKTGRSALLGWGRLERMHRVIEEERYEIEHHRPQEREELTALYAAKGFSGRLLEEAVDVLMADDNRLLQVMLQEELGMPLESQEHPLKQAAGAGLGVLTATVLLALALFTLPPVGTLITALVLVAVFAGAVAHRERNRVTPAIIWNLAIAALAAGVTTLAAELILP